MKPLIEHKSIQDDNNFDQYILETKIQSPQTSLQSGSIKSIRRNLELIDLIEDDNDDDWSFVPKHILSHAKRAIPRRVIKAKTDNGILLKVERKVHLRVQVMWKDSTISWCAADALRHQNPFIFIPYVIKNNLSKHNDFLWVKDYWEDDGISRKIYKSFKATTKMSSHPKYKFGIQIPSNTQHAYKLDRINNDKGRELATDKEIESINKHKTFIVLEEHEPLPAGYQ